MKKAICLILSLVLCIGLLAGCGGKTETPKTDTPKTDTTPTEAPSGGKGESALINTGGAITEGNQSEATPPPQEAEYYDELRMYIGDKVAVIDPMSANAGGTQLGIIDHMYCDTLVYYNINGNYDPCLATEWSTNEDATEWTYKLREGVKFHNGEPFTADDVVFTFNKAMENPGCAPSSLWNTVDRVEANGDYEVTFYLKGGNVDFIYKTADPTAVIVNREAYESGDEHAGWIGTGPFKIVSMIPNDSITYEANEDYWGEKPYCKKFTQRYIAEETARNIMLENDELDFVNVSGQYIKQYSEDPRFVINSYVMNNLNFVGFNMSKPITGDKNFRLACAYAMDREEILDIALDGYGQVAETGAYWGFKTAYKNMNIPTWEQDLDKAKEYLAQSPYKGETLTICALSMPQTSKSAQAVQAQLGAIGIKCEIETMDSPGMTAATAWDANDKDFIVTSGALSPLGDSVRALITPNNNFNKAKYNNPEVLALLDEAAATPDGPERQELYYKIQEMMTEDLPYYPTFHMALYIAAQKGTGGTVFFPTNHHDYGLAYRLKNPD